MGVCEIWNAANIAFGMCPLLTNGAIDSIFIGGSDELKSRYLPRMISGEWTGTMNLTEPQAGSDLNGITTRAMPTGDGTYRITGTKIYISYGERLPDAPPGTRGISLFLVPKVLVNDDGSLGARNDVVCAGLEHKMGIIASPTCVMKFGERGGAVGYLVGEENRGLNTMFIMMNAARLAVGVQGVAVAERATQRALAFARERRQGRAAAGNGGGMAPIIQHPDIRRILLTMQVLTKAARGICMATAAAADLAHHANDPSLREKAAGRVALLTPIAKAFSTDAAVEAASLGIQVHGGMGFIEETGAAQHMRDARILPIYEGTNGIQAIDLVMRKLPLSAGAVLKTYLGEVEATIEAIEIRSADGLRGIAEPLGDALVALRRASQWMGQAIPAEPEAALAGATPYCRLFGIVAGGDALAKAALSAGGEFNNNELLRFYADSISVTAPGLARTVMEGARSVLDANLGVPA
jgi:acyl-CoA dehydrogenase